MLESRSHLTVVRKSGHPSRIVFPVIAAALVLAAGVGPVRSAVPGTNGQIAYTSDSNGDGVQLYVIDAIGGAPSELTAFGNPVENPAWSPDGTKIAFARFGDLLVIDPDSRAVTPVSDQSNSVEAHEPTWSPDGTMLAFSRRSGADTGIWRINVDGTGLIRLTDRDDRDPAWSPDGGSIAFTRWALGFGEVGYSPGQDIYVMNPDGSGQVRLTGRNNASDPTWSPDGSEIAYVSREPEPDIYVLNPNDFGSVLRQVTFDSAYEFGPSWSPDGTRIVFERGRADGSNNDVFSADADGSGHETQLTSGHGDHSPDWQSLSAPAPTQPICSIGSTRVAEGDAGTTDAVFEIDCTNPTTTAASVDYATAPGTAHATADYMSKTNTFSVAPGDSHLQIRVRVVGDTAPEPHETFAVTLASSDVVIDRPTATATIVDDDGFTVRVETLSVTEGNANFQDVDLGVTLSHSADQEVRADLVVRSVAAQFGVDHYLLSSATVVFDSGDVREVVTFRIYGDLDVEGDQKIEILPIAQLVTDANSLDGGIWIRDDDLATLSIDDVTIPEGLSPGIATFTVTRSNVADDVSVHYGAYDFVDESARAGDDYVENEGLLSFAPGSPTATIEISIIDDALDEPDETFGVRLSAPANATIADDAGVGTITDDDDPPTVSIADSAKTEGDSGTTTMPFKVDLSAPSGRVITVNYATSDGSATAPDDYTASSDTVTFAPGETSHQVLVGVVGDTADEFDESFAIDLSHPANVAVADGSAEGTIQNDDSPPAVSINSIDVLEGDTGLTRAIFTVSLPAPSGKTVRVAYATGDGTASAVLDYMPAADDIVFAPGETAKELPIDIVGDVVIEANETFTVNLSGGTDVPILDATGTATIVDDDEPLVPIEHRLASGSRHTCAVTTAGGVRCWGSTVSGALGRGNTSGPLSAAPVVGLSSGVVAVTSGLTHSCALTASGGVKCWGTNDQGQLGDGTTDDHFAPIDVPSLTSGVVAVAAGGLSTCALTTTGAVKCWGFNDAGQLGDGTDERRLTPVDVTGLPGGAVGVTAGWFHACALMGDGSIRCWGADSAGQLGDGTTGVHGVRATPVRVLGLPAPMTAVTAGLFHTCGLTNAGQALCWGGNDSGQLGDGTTDDSLTPVGVLTMATGVAEISAGARATCARTVGGAAKCWGTNEFGQLGNDGSPVGSASPVQVTGLASGVTAISAGSTIGCALTATVAAKCWGAGGNVGDGVFEQRNAPVFIPGYGVVLSIDDMVALEGPARTWAFTVSLAEATGSDVTVHYETSDADAAAGSDYTTTGGTLRIPAGQTSGQITVAVLDDARSEPTETFIVALSNASNAAIARAVGTATIIDDDVAVPELSIDDVTVTEGDSGGTPATFMVTLSTPSSTPVTVDYATLGFDALAGQDYDSRSGKLTFAPDDTSETITVNVLGDPVVEPDETFQMELGNAVGATIADDAGTATIVNDDVYADVSILVTADHDTATNPVGAGGRLVYTLAITNHGRGPAVDIRVTDAVPHTSIPNDAAFCMVVLPATTCDTSTGSPYGTDTAIPTISALGSGESTMYQLGYTVDPGTPSGPMGNTATITTYSSDSDPANDSSTATVRVDALPVASFTFSPAAPVVGGTVSFDGSGSTDDAPLADFAWAFGDGANGTGSMATHTYTTAGTYAATLTVTDAVGGTSTATRSVVVGNAPPPPPPPSAGRALRGTVTQVVAFGPGGDPADGRVPLAGAVVSVGNARQGVQTTTDAQGRYVFTDLTLGCGTCELTVTLPGSATAILQTSVALGGNPSVTVSDLVVGSARDQLYVTGRILPPAVEPGDPQPPAPLTVGVRVYRGNPDNPRNLIVDSATVFPGPGGFGAYQLLLGRAGAPLPGQYRVYLYENGDQVASSGLQLPQPSGTFAPVVVTVADLVGLNPPPSAGRALRGTVTQVVAFGPGGDPADGRVPLAGAVVSVGNARQGVQTTTDAQGRYVFTDLTLGCGTCELTVTLPGSATAILQTSVALGGNPSVTVSDLVVGSARDQLYVTGRILPPAVEPGDPQPPAPLTVGVRVYRGNPDNPRNLIVDSATVFPGPGGFGAYQLLLGRAGAPLPGQYRVYLYENGDQVASSGLQLPQPSGTFAPVVVTVADLVGLNPPPSAGRALRGTVTQVVAFGPGGDPADGRVPLAGAVVSVGNARQGVQTTTDAQGRYVFTDLTLGCGTCELTVTLPGSATAILQTSVALGGNPSVTVSDLVVGSARDQLYVTGRILPPAVEPGDPQPPAPLTVGVRVYRGNPDNPRNLIVDSATVFPGPGGFGAYQLLLGRAGAPLPGQYRVYLYENGDQVASSGLQLPQPSGTFAPVVVTVADLVGQ